MNVADSPEIAVRFGSASVRITPAPSMARMVAWIEGTGTPLRVAEPKPATAELPASERPSAVKGLLLSNVTAVVPQFMVAGRAAPNSLVILLRRPATVT